MIDYINTSRTANIVTIEDPIEFLHRDKKSIVNQREIGSDTFSFGDALRSALRQDPDVILVGEMRDFETISIALTAAETGHLVLSTLHTRGRGGDDQPHHQRVPAVSAETGQDAARLGDQGHRVAAARVPGPTAPAACPPSK